MSTSNTQPDQPSFDKFDQLETLAREVSDITDETINTPAELAKALRDHARLAVDDSFRGAEIDAPENVADASFNDPVSDQQLSPETEEAISDLAVKAKDFVEDVNKHKPEDEYEEAIKEEEFLEYLREEGELEDPED